MNGLVEYFVLILNVFIFFGLNCRLLINVWVLLSVVNVVVGMLLIMVIGVFKVE